MFSSKRGLANEIMGYVRAQLGWTRAAFGQRIDAAIKNMSALAKEPRITSQDFNNVRMIIGTMDDPAFGVRPDQLCVHFVTLTKRNISPNLITALSEHELLAGCTNYANDGGGRTFIVDAYAGDIVRVYVGMFHGALNAQRAAVQRSAGV
ncbi:MAG TPA: hypothetical protein VLG40_03885 [Candidatus Saccharimonas sp.]|nr:hypothetical protein [Candidatus Saccharimonas sp.]